MPTFRTTGQLDDPYIEDGDPAFTGLDQRTEPLLLEAGMVQLAENVRFDKGVISLRKGLTSVDEKAGGIGFMKFSDPNSGVEDLLVIYPDKVEGVTTQLSLQINNPFSSNDYVYGVQAFEKVLLFANGKVPKEWTPTSGNIIYDMSRTPANSAINFVCPPVPFGQYLSNRLVVPYYDDSNSTVAFSDLLQPNQFTLTNTFFCNKGTSDITLAICGFTSNQAIIFNRNSVHIISNTHSLGVNSTNFEITRQYGIAGHKAFAQNGSYIYFISNEGNIQVIVPSSDPQKGMGIALSQITLDQEPLSRPIQDTIDQIDLRSLSKSVVHYHRNKVYFTFGINSENCNTIAIYDSLLSKWVSIDTFDYDIDIRDFGSLGKDLYLLTDTDTFKYEDGLSDKTAKIRGKFITRDYILNSREIKKFVRGSCGYEISDGVNLKIKTNTKNPDSTVISKDVVFEEDETALSRFNVSQRGHTANVELEFSFDQFDNIYNNDLRFAKFKSVSLEAYANSRTTGDFT